VFHFRKHHVQRPVVSRLWSSGLRCCVVLYVGTSINRGACCVLLQSRRNELESLAASIYRVHEVTFLESAAASVFRMECDLKQCVPSLFKMHAVN